jgi:hypothetical protein
MKSNVVPQTKVVANVFPGKQQKWGQREKIALQRLFAHKHDISQIETEDISAFLPEPVEGRKGGKIPSFFFQDNICVKICVLFAVTLSSLMQVDLHNHLRFQYVFL